MNEQDHVSEGAAARAVEGRRARKARATRRALLEAGLASFERQPISLVSVLDITEAADVAKGVFYLHFPSKDVFLIELWLDVQRSFLDRLVEAVKPQQQLRDRLAAAITAYSQTASEHAREVAFLLRMSSFIGDELGVPGQLARQRALYLESLARTIIGASVRQRLPKRAIAAVGAMDACCWAVIWQAMQLGRRLPGDADLAKIVLRLVEPLADELAS